MTSGLVACVPAALGRACCGTNGLFLNAGAAYVTCVPVVVVALLLFFAVVVERTCG